MKTNGATWKAYLASWPDGQWFDDSDETINGKKIDYLPDDVLDDAEVEFTCGVVFTTPDAREEEPLTAHFRRWLKAQTIARLVVEIPKDQEAALLQFIHTTRGGFDMLKHKVSELEGVLLDEAVAMAGDVAVEKMGNHICIWDKPDGVWRGWSPSTDWRVGGPIIDRERISLVACEVRGEVGYFASSDKYLSCIDEDMSVIGPTPLIAAMRAYAASRFGEYVELPC